LGSNNQFIDLEPLLSYPTLFLENKSLKEKAHKDNNNNEAFSHKVGLPGHREKAP